MLNYEFEEYRVNNITKTREKKTAHFDTEETAVAFVKEHKDEWVWFNLEKVFTASNFD